MSPKYLADRIPVIPLAVFLDEKILAVHIEGQPVEDVNWTVTAVGPGSEAGTVRISYVDEAGKKGSRGLCSTSDWVSVPFPRIDPAPTRDAFEVAA